MFNNIFYFCKMKKTKEQPNEYFFMKKRDVRFLKIRDLSLKALLICFMALWLLAAGMPAQAQLVNIEERRKSSQDTLVGFIGLSFKLTQNTKEIRQGKNSIGLQWDRREHTLMLFNDLTLMQIDKDNIINSGFQHLRYNYTFRDTSAFVLEAFVQNQYNSVKLLKQRVITGGGPRFRIFDRKSAYLYLAPLVMYEYESLSDSLETETSWFKGDFYISLGYRFSSFVSINNVTYYQPAFSDWSDFRISSESSLNVALTNHLGLKVIYDLAYDSDPPEDIPKLFYTFNTAINFKF